MSKERLPYEVYEALFQLRASHTGLDHLRWVYHRMVEVHGENENFDYMLTFKDVIRDLEKTEKVFGVHRRQHEIIDDASERDSPDLLA